MSARVRVVVVSYNTRDLLDRCLGALRADVESGTAEVVVVDNASRDGSAELVARRHRWARLLAQPRNAGFGSAVNAGAAGARSDWIAIANADTAVRPGAIAALLAAGEGDPEAGLVAPRLIAPDGSTQHSVHPFPTLGVALATLPGVAALAPGLARRLAFAGAWDPERKRRVDWAHGAFLLARRASFEAVEGFDEAHWMYAEDIDLAWRVRAAGFHTAYEPAAWVDHAVAAATAVEFAGERNVRHLAASYAWQARRRSRTYMWAVGAVNLVAACARVALLALPAAMLGGRWRTRWVHSRAFARLHAAALRRNRGALDPP